MFQTKSWNGLSTRNEGEDFDAALAAAKRRAADEGSLVKLIDTKIDMVLDVAADGRTAKWQAYSAPIDPNNP